MPIVREVNKAFDLDQFRHSVVAQKWDTGIVEAFCLRGKTYQEHPPVIYARLRYEALFFC